MDNFLEELKSIFNFGHTIEQKEDELVNQDTIIEEENRTFHRRMKNRKRQTVSWFNQNEKEFCPHCVSSKLRNRYSHIGNKEERTNMTTTKTINEDNENKSNYDSYIFSFSFTKNNGNNTSMSNNNISGIKVSENEDENGYKEKFDEIYNYALSKKNTANFPLIDYVNFKKINNLVCQDYNNDIVNMMVTQSLSYELLLQFIYLIKQRSIESLENNEDITYPYCCYIPIQNFDFNEVENLKEIFRKNKVNKYEVILIPIQIGEWNLIAIYPSESMCNFYYCGGDTLSCEILDRFTSLISTQKSWQLNHINPFTGISPEEKNGTQVLILLDYLSRGQKTDGFTFEDISFYSIVIGIEMMNKRLYTY